MKVTSKLVVGMLLCAGLVQVVSSKPIKITLELQDKNAKYKYALGNAVEPAQSTKTSKYKNVLPNGTTISFDDATPTYLYVKPAKGSKKISSIGLKAPESKLYGDDIIVILVSGAVQYGNSRNLDSLRQQISK